MKTTTMTTRATTSPMLMLILAGLLATTIVGCGGGGDDEPTGESTDATEQSEALPTAEMLNITETGEADGALSVQVQGLNDSSGALRDHITTVRGNLQTLIDKTQTQIDRVVSQGTLQAVATEAASGDLGAQLEQCARWTFAGSAADWELTACRVGKQVDGLGAGKVQAWVLKARPTGSADAPKPVAAGVGIRLGTYGGKRGGAGRIGYNFDNLAAALGESYGGKLAVAYRATGAARQVVLGTKDLKPADSAETYSSLYRYTHLRGKGGLLTMATIHDVLKRDAAGALEMGKDQQPEAVRIAIGWNRTGKARAAAVACGGTVGEGQCAHVRQCWEASVDYEAIGTDAGAVSWEATSCGVVPMPVEGAPAEGDVAGTDSADALTIPGAIDGE